MSGAGNVGAWQPIATAPELERVFVCGWQKQAGNVRGYWWWHEDCVSDGVAIEHPEALYWTAIVLPPFPPSEGEG